MHADSHSTIDRHLLDRYLSGECDAVEIEQVRGWLASHPDQAARLNRPAVLSAREVDAGRERIAGRIASRADRGSAGRGSASPSLRAHEGSHAWTPRPSFFRLSTISTVIVGAIAVIFGWYAGVARMREHRQLYTMTYYSTGNGERANITLPDGSTVILNVASRLAVPGDYAAGNHTVRLSGEAFFSINHHDGKPFTVVAGSTATRVLGTSFVVRYYGTDTSAMVAVRDGKVEVDRTVVTANRLAEVWRTGRTQLRPSDASAYTFATGTLTLTNLSLKQAVVELDRWYDADIRLGDPSLARRHMEGEFSAGALTDLAAILELTYNVRVVRDGRVLTLYPKQ